MKKIILTFTLTFCFGFSSVNGALATQIVNSSPIIVQPYDLRATTRQDAAINQTMINYSSDVIERNYKILTELKDEMVALNEKFDQGGKIRMLTQRMGEMDQRIAQLNDAIRWLKLVLAAAKNKAEYYQLTSQQDQLSVQQAQKEAQQIKDDFAQLGLRLSRKQAEADLLKSELENQITALKTAVQSGQKSQAQSDALKQQLADQQNTVDILRQELNNKNAQLAQMTLMISEYQKKLESKNNAYNEQWGQLLSSKNYQARMEGQIADLNTRLQQKEAQVVKIKKDMYDLQESAGVKDRDLQAKDLSLSTELALARQQLKGMPGSVKEQLQSAYAIEGKPDEKTQDDRLREKLKQALDEIDAQGRMINVLAQKLQECAQKADLTRQ